MIWLLRNIGVHLWIATLLTVPAVFVLLPVLKPVFPGIDPMLTVMVIFVVFFAGLGTLMDMAARKMVLHLISEGQTWERSGVVENAKKAYLKAIRVYDTFLFWPFFSKKTAGIICGAIARCDVNSRQRDENFTLASTLYLSLHPEDEDIALSWLRQLKYKTVITAGDQQVLSALARHHGRHSMIQEMLIQIFLELERKDFIARKLYGYILETPETKERYEARIRELVGEPEVIAEEPEPALPVKRKVKKNIQIGPLAKKAAVKFWSVTAEAPPRLLGWVKKGQSGLVKAVVWLKEHPKPRRHMKTVLLAVACVWVAFFIYSTMSHLFKRKPEKKPAQEIEKQVPKPFTIQVAAYLKPKHADRYVETLKNKGIDASVVKVHGGGKTWFLVRVSEFETKQSATEYGNKLKKQKIIDDFFVNNK